MFKYILFLCNEKEIYWRMIRLEHEHYMDIKFLISVWEGDMSRGIEMSEGEKWVLTKFFKKMNRQQRWDTLDGNHNISRVLYYAKMIDKERNVLFEVDEEQERGEVKKKGLLRWLKK
jgi:hypothetical protein